MRSLFRSTAPSRSATCHHEDTATRTQALWPHWIAAAMVATVLIGCDDDQTVEPHMDDPSSVPIHAVDDDVLYVVNGGSNSISVIDTGSNEVAGTIELLNVSFPHHAYLDRSRTALVVAAPGFDLSGGHADEDHHGGGGHGVEGTVLVLEAHTGATRAARRLPAPNHNVAPSPDGQQLWTAQMGEPGSVLVLDGSSLAAIDTIPVGDMPSEVTFTPDGTRAFVANTGSNNVSVIDVATRAVVSTIPVGQDPVGAWPAGNGVMYVDNEYSMTLTAIDAASLSVVRTYDLGFTPGMAALAPNGELWVTDSDGGQVVFFNAGTGARLGEVATGAGAHGIAFGLGGDTAYVSNQMAGTVSVVDVGTHALVQSIPVGAKPNGVIFRPAP